MAKRSITDNKTEVAAIYRKASKKAMQAGNNSVSIRTLREALEAADIIVTNKDGTPKGDQALRLAINKAVGDLVNAAVGSGKFATKEIGKEWKKKRFLRITSPLHIEGIEGIIDDLD
jgi:hypothetical protein